VAYNFHNQEIDIPRAVCPQGSEIGIAKLAINGKIAITAQSRKD